MEATELKQLGERATTARLAIVKALKKTKSGAATAVVPVPALGHMLVVLSETEKLAARLSTLEAANASLKEELAEQETEKLALVKEIQCVLPQYGPKLFNALSALASMWNQYCPPPYTHEFMSAGEDAEDVLMSWALLRKDETCISPDLDGDEVPARVRALRAPAPTAPLEAAAPDADMSGCIHGGCANPAAHDGHCSCYLLGVSDTESHQITSNGALEPWRAVFPTQEAYDASVQSVVERIKSGEAKPIERAIPLPKSQCENCGRKSLDTCPNGCLFGTGGTCPACGKYLSYKPIAAALPTTGEGKE